MHTIPRREWMGAAVGLVVIMLLTVTWNQSRAETYNLLNNPQFTGAEEQMPPPGWNLYGTASDGHGISVVEAANPELRALLIENSSGSLPGTGGEMGIHQTVLGKPGPYIATVRLGAVAGAPDSGATLQMRFIPSGAYVQKEFVPDDAVGFDEFSLEAEAPAGTIMIRVYLYTTESARSQVRVQSIGLRQNISVEELDHLHRSTIDGFEPLNFDLSTGSLESPPLHELRAAIPEGRPRLFARPETIDELRAKPSVSPIAGLVWRNIQTRALGFQYSPLPPYPPDARPGGVLDITAWRRGIEIANDVVARLETLSFRYLIEGDTVSGEAAKRLLLHVSTWDPYGHSGREKNDEISMRLLYSMSRAYDWIHPLFTDAERLQVQEAVRERGNDVYATMRRGRFEERLLSNHLVRSMGFLGEAAIAFMGDFPEAEVWFDYIVSLFLVKYPPWGGDEGGWSQGVSYWQSYISWVLEFLDALKIATGLDLYQKPFLQNTGYFKLYAHPPKSKFGAFGDHSDVPPNSGSASVMSRLALEYQNPAFQWYVNEINGMGNVPAIPMNDFLGYILAPIGIVGSGRPQLPPEFPQSRLFSDVGWALMNVDMEDWQNNVHIKFKSSPYGSFNHSHAEQNSFQIEAYGSPLAIPSGYYPWYGSPHHAEWTWQSRSKNTILVDGRGQGVQSLDAKGEIVATSFGSQFDYVLGDATDAYLGQLGYFGRHLLFVKPNLILIYDQLKSDKPVATYDWLLHSLQEIEVDAPANRVLVNGDTAHMWVNFVTPESLTFHVTDEFPIAPEEREAHKPNHWHLTTTTLSVGGEANFLTSLVPRPNARIEDAPPLTTALSAEGGHAMSLTMDGTHYRIGFRDEKSGHVQLRFDGMQTDATAIVRWTPEESEAVQDEGLIAVGVRSLQRDGVDEIRSASTVDLGIHWQRSDSDPGVGRLSLQMSGDPKWLELAAPFAVERVEVNGHALDHGWTQKGDVLRLDL